MLIERAKAVTIEAAKRRAAQVVAAATTGLAEVRLPKCKICKEKRRTGNAALLKASASSKLPVVAGKAVGADVEEGAAVVSAVEEGAGADDDE